MPFMPENKIRVQIYEDNADLREMLCMLIKHSSDFIFCGKYANCANVEANMEEGNPDVILCDIEMPFVDGMEGVRRIRAVDSEVLILMYTVFEDDDHLFEALCRGANGYLLKGDSPAVILQAIKEVCEGGAPMSPTVAKKVIQFFAKQNQKAASSLTQREKEILTLLVNGNSVKMIAAEISISFQTVKTHLKNIYDKLHVHSQTEAVSKALRERLI